MQNSHIFKLYIKIIDIAREGCLQLHGLHPRVPSSCALCEREIKGHTCRAVAETVSLIVKTVFICVYVYIAPGICQADILHSPLWIPSKHVILFLHQFPAFLQNGELTYERERRREKKLSEKYNYIHHLFIVVVKFHEFSEPGCPSLQFSGEV